MWNDVRFSTKNGYVRFISNKFHFTNLILIELDLNSNLMLLKLLLAFSFLMSVTLSIQTTLSKEMDSRLSKFTVFFDTAGH